MKIELKDLKELENGGAEFQLETDAEGHQYLLNYAILELIKKGLVEVKQMYASK